MLSEHSDSDTEQLNQLTVNEHYAKAYAHKKEREELGRLKEKYGSDAEEEDDDEDSEDLETEDEDGEELTPGIDAAILRLLAKIKRRDPEIYEKDKPVFDEEKQRSGTLTSSLREPNDKSKPITLRQQKLMDELASTSRSVSPEPPTHVEEQRQLRDETIAAFHHAIDDGDDLLVPREKTKDELEREEEEYRAFLEREVGEDFKGLIEVDHDEYGIREDARDGIASESKKKNKKTKDKKRVEQDDQEFLMNYILNRGWIDRTARRLPTYTEVTSIKRPKGKGKAELASKDTGSSDGDIDSQVSQTDELEAEDEFDDVVDAFESSYNFRFEEPEASAITQHPRNITSTVRRQDTTRKDARERKKARKEEELLKKKEEVKRLKALKMKELRIKLERVGRVGGWDDIEGNEAFQELDLDGDWDPNAHDKQMAKIYQTEDDGLDMDKPTWDDDIEIGDILPPQDSDNKKSRKKRKKKEKGDTADKGVDLAAMDADQSTIGYDDEEWDGTEEMRKRKLNEYMDEVYGMDFNDMVGGMPTRFTYMDTAPQTYGLSAADILMADDQDLNQYMGIKRYAAYRRGSAWDSQRPERLKEFKQKLAEKGKIYDNGEERPVKRRKGKKERQRLKAATEGPGDIKTEEEVKTTLEGKKRKREGEIMKLESTETQVHTKRRKRRHKKAVAME